MAITSSIGYGGTVEEDDIAVWRRSFPATYGVVGATDWAVTLKTGVDRTVGIAAGVGFGHAVVDTNGAEVTKQLTTLASGTRYDLIVARRDWSGAGGATAFNFVTGTSSMTAAFASRNQTPGTLDDQPLALVQVTGNGGGGVIANIYDLRVWASNGGAVAAAGSPAALGTDGKPLVLQYLNEVGTEVWYGDDLWHRYVDGVGAAQWSKTSSRFVLKSGLTGAAAPAGAVPLIQAFPIQSITSSLGAAAITFPEAFATAPVVVAMIVDYLGTNPVIPSSAITASGCTLYWPSNPSAIFLVNVIAIGWRP